jgi:purine-nucleoside phosphorylase
MLIKQINECVAFLNKKGIAGSEVGIVLGTGLGKLVDSIGIIAEVPYEEIPHFPIATVEFHSGKLIYGELEGKRVLAMNGRFHYYEGYNMREITFPIRVMKALGVQNLLLSNAAGCMDLSWNKGDLMLIDDHINLLPDNPLFGKNTDELGPRFPDMSRPYSPSLNEAMKNLAKSEGIPLHEGVYVAVAGPNLETRAEYRFLRNAGADAVGMSTVPEVIVANHMKLPCAAVSVLTDVCDPDHLEEINIDDIIAVAGRAEEKLVVLFKALIKQL